jgi:signal transduction histidine kinase
VRELKQYSKQAKFSAELILNRVGEIMDTANREKNTLSLNLQELDLAVSLQQILKSVQFTLDLKGMDSQLNVRQEALALLGKVLTDEVRIQQFSQNFLTNAIKFSQKQSSIRLEPQIIAIHSLDLLQHKLTAKLDWSKEQAVPNGFEVLGVGQAQSSQQILDSKEVSKFL